MPNTKNKEYIIKEISVLDTLTDIILIGHLICLVAFILTAFKTLFQEKYLFSVILFVFAYVLKGSINTVVKYTGIKKVHLTKAGLRIQYIKFNRPLLKDFIPWEDIFDCRAVEIRFADKNTRKILLQYRQKKKSLVLGNLVKKADAQLFVDAVYDFRLKNGFL